MLKFRGPDRRLGGEVDTSGPRSVCVSTLLCSAQDAHQHIVHVCSVCLLYMLMQAGVRTR